MEPIPETTEAVEEFGPFADGLLQTLTAQGRRVRAIVPDCVGVSLASLENGVTFTLASTAEELSLLDALQYAAGGPCVDAVEQDRVLHYAPDDPLNEDQWQLFARGTAAVGIASTLSLPILADETVVGGVNLYAASAHAFTGHHEGIANIFGAWAAGAITNADLSFTTRATAEAAPGKLRDDYNIGVAVAMFAAIKDITLDAARVQLRLAAQRAGVDEAQLADTVIQLGHLPRSDEGPGLE